MTSLLVPIASVTLLLTFFSAAKGGDLLALPSDRIEDAAYRARDVVRRKYLAYDPHREGGYGYDHKTYVPVHVDHYDYKPHVVKQPIYSEHKQPKYPVYATNYGHDRYREPHGDVYDSYDIYDADEYDYHGDDYSLHENFPVYDHRHNSVHGGGYAPAYGGGHKVGHGVVRNYVIRDPYLH